MPCQFFSIRENNELAIENNDSAPDWSTKK
jgi:hypothetical protein